MKKKTFHLFRIIELPVFAVLLLFITPLFGSLILGYQFSSHSILHVPTIIVDHDNSSLSRELIRLIDTNQVFNVKYFSDQNNDIESLISKGRVAVGVIIPPHFSKDLLNGKAPKVAVIYDGTQMSMAGAAKGRISEVLSTIKTGYLMQIMQGKLGVMPAVSQKVVLPMSFNSRYIGNPTKNLPNFYLEGLVINMAQITAFLLGLELADLNKKRYRYLWLSGIAGGIFGVISVALAIAALVGCFKVPFRGNGMAVLCLAIPFMIGMTNLGIALRLLIKNKPMVISAGGTLISATFLFAGYTFPVLAMPDCLQSVYKFMPFFYFGIPVRDISLIGSSLTQFIPELRWLIQFVVLMWIVNWAIFILKKRVQSNYDWDDKKLSDEACT
jgi:ABC-2 type transport system permease protein